MSRRCAPAIRSTTPIGCPGCRAVARWIDDRLAAHEPGVITCSNLKRAYRDITIGNRAGVRLIYLKGDEHVIHNRKIGLIANCRVIATGNSVAKPFIAA
jgi:hypothetical protein